MNSVNDRLEEAIEDAKYEGYVVGFVTENNDPKGVARVKVKIPQVLDTDQGPVPWCLPSKKSPFGQGMGYGVYGSPKIGSPVRITFQNGDPHYPVYECDEYLATHANPKFQDPNTWGYKDPGGSELFVNMTTGAWEWTHQTGSLFKYDGQGNLTVHNVKNETTQVDGNSQKTINGTLNFTVIGNATFDVQGSLQATVGGGATMNVTGDTNLTSSGAVNISGSTINLN